MRKLSGYGPSIVVLLTAVVVLVAGPRAVQRLTYENTRAKVMQARLSLDHSDVLERINQAYRDIATIVEPSVVHISVHYIDRDRPGREDRGISSGSGWIFDDEGHIVTNHHVIRNAVRIDVQLYNGMVREATLIGADPTTDIAVIKITPGLLHPAQLANLDEPVRQGDLVFAFGSPFDFRFSMSAGVVSGKDRSVGILRDERGRRIGYENFIQVDAAINPGNSGGPLTDYRGRVIGMNTAIATTLRNSFDEGQFAGIGLAIPLDMIYPVVTQLIGNGIVEKGYLGVFLPPSEQDNASLLATIGYNGSGVMITDVVAGEPAALAGVKRGDVITQINGRPVRAVPQLQSIISSMRPGDRATLAVWRVDSERQVSEMAEIDVTLTRLELGPIARGGESLPARDPLQALGFQRLATATPALANELNIEYRPGVVLLEVRPDSFVAQSFESRTTVVGINDMPVRTVDEFLSVLRGLSSQLQDVRLQAYDAQGERRTLRLNIE